MVREVLGLEEGAVLLTGLAIGYEDVWERVNGMRTERDAVSTRLFLPVREDVAVLQDSELRFSIC